MISNTKYKTIYIDIVTYKRKPYKRRKLIMDKDKYKYNTNRFVCSVCLNRNASKEDTKYVECCRRKSKTCPICQKNYNQFIEYPELSITTKETILAKNVQTSQSDVTKGLSLLNEVLNEFQNKKQTVTKKDKSNTIILKDACVNTERNVPRLSVSKIFYYSINEDVVNGNNCKCSIINCQPEIKTSAALFKHKSSSIPQMKLDELKNSLKQKTTSKDAIEEVNRMFANVKKIDKSENNRPLIRNGPRVLPVVKTGKLCDNNVGIATLNCNCQNFKMSSGDSECCHRGNYECLHMCCHYQQRLNVEYCSNCRKKFDQ